MDARKYAAHAVANDHQGTVYAVEQDCLVQGIPQLEGGERNGLSGGVIEKPELIVPAISGSASKVLTTGAHIRGVDIRP